MFTNKIEKNTNMTDSNDDKKQVQRYAAYGYAGLVGAGFFWNV